MQSEPQVDQELQGVQEPSRQGTLQSRLSRACPLQAAPPLTGAGEEQVLSRRCTPRPQPREALQSPQMPQPLQLPSTGGGGGRSH